MVLSQVVKDLTQQPIFSKVDLLADDLRRNVADPKVTLPDKDYVLTLDFAQTDFVAAAPRKPAAARPAPRRPPRTGPDGETLGQAAP